MSTWRVDHGDCLDLLRAMPDASVDACLTDPPYSSGGQFRGDRTQSTRTKYQSSDVVGEFKSFTGDNRDQRSFAFWCTLWMSEVLRIVKPGGMLCVFTDWRQLPTTTDCVQSGGWVWRGIVPWDKVMARPVPNRFRSQAEYMVWATNGPRSTDTEGATYGAGVLRVNTEPTATREHSTQKPVSLMRQIIETACIPGGTVLDPFSGSGSTGVACVEPGRNFIGFELDEHYATVARRRIAEAANVLGGPVCVA